MEDWVGIKLEVEDFLEKTIGDERRVYFRFFEEKGILSVSVYSDGKILTRLTRATPAQAGYIEEVIRETVLTFAA